ncbi:hypothetical protein BD309DRAFT_970550 [Dichomitus squalens]|uniref:Nab2 type CCCH zinc finger 4 domain-containing protein n=2 Tax=Dichomitus squalens TaxID=114155 RepID=A0A4Q9NF46_9APHY|nr:uncharacterized protein DICSQDRAFT_111596 [Dichomitus squalens LYAD-421 SS1]EJF57536.1 hypothetical protein DICSQDRAFT_111596 [Dichomitus squalens LYAD-421 SS1]TBU39045.1 hypothetical protein BD309DRAFT_970550 [Dichomitus squalens]TBU52944.1 hypothetical protein BD310DRAFT_861097 [Dichomitus squalens]
MAFGLTMGTERATALQNAIQDELMKRQYSTEPDPVMAEYITIMVINNKTAAQITSELEDLIGSDFDASFVDWLFAEAGKGAPEAEAPAPPEPSTSIQAPVRDSPPHQAADNRRPPNGPRAGAPLYQQALSQAIPSTSPPSQKRTASARSPSPGGHPPAKSRRTDLPTGPRAMFRERDGHGPGGSRSLLDRVGPRGGQGPQSYPRDDVQARIDSITNGPGPDPNMMMMNGGFPMGAMPGMDMGAMAMANPLMLQELMMSQMAMMSQIAGAMGIMNPATGQFMNNGFPMQQGMGDMNGFNNGMGGQMGQGGDGNGRGRGRGRGGPTRGAGRGRGGHTGHHVGEPSVNDGTPAPASAAPTPQPVASILPSKSAPSTLVTPIPITPTSSMGSARPGFVPPERPQSPTLCKFALKCTNPVCRYSHPSPVATAESGIVLSNDPCENGKDCKDKDCIKAHVSPAVLNISAEVPKPQSYVPTPAPTPQGATPCRYGAACTRPSCTFSHPPRPSSHHASIPCKFGTACTRVTCPYQHPEGRVLPTSFHRGLTTSGGLVNVPSPETGSIGAQSHHKSVTFKRPDGTPTTAAELEKKVKEMEERKNEAQKAIAQAQAGKKDDASPTVPISA